MTTRYLPKNLPSSRPLGRDFQPTFPKDTLFLLFSFIPETSNGGSDLWTWPQTKPSHTFRINLFSSGSPIWASESFREENLCRPPGDHPDDVSCAGSGMLFEARNDHFPETATLTDASLIPSRGRNSYMMLFGYFQRISKINARDLRPRTEDPKSDPEHYGGRYFFGQFFKIAHF